jgi:hypothetical protein
MVGPNASEADAGSGRENQSFQAKLDQFLLSIVGSYRLALLMLCLFFAARLIPILVVHVDRELLVSIYHVSGWHIWLTMAAAANIPR